MILEVSNLFSGYFGEDVLHDVSIEVAENECVAILGPNGCGKSTLFKTITGAVRARSGKILFQGKDVTHLPAHEKVKLGLSLVPQGKSVFPQMTVRENLEMGAYTIRSESLFETRLNRVLELFPGLKSRLNVRAGALSGGEQKMVEIARALMLEPRCLLFDEPSLGLSPKLASEVFDTIRALKEKTTLLIVEQNPMLALSVSSGAYLMDLGEVKYKGTPEELLANKSLWDVYFAVK